MRFPALAPSNSCGKPVWCASQMDWRRRAFFVRVKNKSSWRRILVIWALCPRIRDIRGIRLRQVILSQYDLFMPLGNSFVQSGKIVKGTRQQSRISCHSKAYNSERSLQNAHGTIDMSLALRERLIDACGMVDQAALKHLQIN